MKMMWICPKCKTTNDTYICTSCGFDASRDYTHHRFLCQLSESASKISKTKMSDDLFSFIFDLFAEKNIRRDNVLMASDDRNYVFGRKIDRKQITTIHFRNKKENIGEDAWDVSEKQNGSIMAWTEKKQDGLLDLYIAADGNIMANRNCSYLFCNYGKLENIFGLEFFRTDQTENMRMMFSSSRSLKSLDVSHFSTSQVTNMSSMFSGCSGLKSLDVSHFSTNQVTDMSSMFSYCYSLKNLDVSHFFTGQVTDMSSMFFNCFGLKNLDVSHLTTSQVTDMSFMFCGCNSLESLDVSHFSTSQVKDMECMFCGCAALENLDVNGFDTKCVENMKNMFERCNNLNLLDISNFDTNSAKHLFVPLLKYLGVPKKVRLKTKKPGGFFREL